MSYIAVGLWTFFALMFVMIYLSSLVSSTSFGGIMFSVFGLLVSGFIVYAGYKNIMDIGHCLEK